MIGVLDIGMTILTIEPELAYVQAMAVFYWLFRSVSYVSELGRKVVPNEQDGENTPCQRAHKS